jgi:hypothetical protein
MLYGRYIAILWEKVNLDPRQNENRPTDKDQNWHGWLRHQDQVTYQVSLTSRVRAWGWFVRRLWLFSYFFFPRLTHSPDGSSDRHHWWLKRFVLVRGGVFYTKGSSKMLSWGHSPPKWRLSGWIGVSQLKQQNGPTAITFELKGQTKSNLQGKLKNWNPIRRRQKISGYPKSKMAAAAVFKNKNTS